MNNLNRLRELNNRRRADAGYITEAEYYERLHLMDIMMDDLLELVEACEWFEESELDAVPEEHGLLGSWNAIKQALLKLRGSNET